MGKLAWSWSRLETFETCPHKFNHMNILKDVPFVPNEAMERGKRIHKDLENGLRFGTPMPADLTHMQDLINDINKLRAENPETITILEEQLAFREDMTTTDWFAKDVWLRMIWDLCLKDGRTAFIGDWKTGKVKDKVTDQLALSAVGAFTLWPDLEEVKSAYIWVDHCETTQGIYTRDQYEGLLQMFGERSELIQIAVERNEWPAKVNHFCKWCPLTKVQCMHRP